MEISLKIARAEELRRLIASLPEANVNLDRVQTVIGEQGFAVPVLREDADDYGLCGSICCIAGAAWLHPPFIEQGIRGVYRSRLNAAYAFFGAPMELFDVYCPEGCETDVEGTHKDVALRRIDAHLANLRADLQVERNLVEALAVSLGGCDSGITS